MAEDYSWIPSGTAFGSNRVIAKSPGGRSYQMLQGGGENDRWWMTPDNQQLQGMEALKNYERDKSAADTARNSLSALVSGASSGGFSSSANPFGTAPTMDTGNAYGAAPVASQSNRFETGLTDAEGRLRSLLDNPDSIKQSAAYKFRLKQGEDAIQRQMGAKGLLNSGNRLMELTKYGQDMGSQEYDAQAGRLNSLLGNYSQSWLGDKNANTSRFAAESNAWNQDKANNTSRFNALSGAWNQAQGNADRNRLGFANLAWDMNKPQGGGGGGSRTISSMITPSNLSHIGGNTPVDWGAFNKKFADERAYLDRY